MTEHEVLLLRRRPDPRDPWSGHWCFPGGGRASSDADLLSTALRELQEECGLELPREALSEELPLAKAGPPERYVVVAPFVLRVAAPMPVQLAEREMTEARWLPLDELRDASRHALRAVPGQPPERLVSTFDLPPTPLWGFTYRLLVNWLHLESPAPSP